MKSWMAKFEDVKRDWWIVDAADKNVGRLSTQIANVLRGKNKPTFTPHADTGDFVVVINADKVKFTGKKWDEKKYYRHSAYFGLKEFSAGEMKERDASEILRKSVQGMLPKNRLSNKLIQKLKIYSGPEHPHAAQKPAQLKLVERA